jgi:hypothetical protein
MNGKARWVIFVLVVAAFAFVGCTAGPNGQEGSAGSNDEVAGFLLGLWHGIIAPVTFVISLFTDNVSLYEVNNNGNWYDFGFVLGAGILFGGGAAGARR